MFKYLNIVYNCSTLMLCRYFVNHNLYAPLTVYRVWDILKKSLHISMLYEEQISEKYWNTMTIFLN